MRAPPRGRWCTPTPSPPCGWLDVAAADRGGRPGVGQRPQVRRPQGGRARWWCAAARRSPPSCTAAPRSAAGVPGPTTWPASSAWPPPCAPPRPARPDAVTRVGRLRDRLADGLAARCRRAWCETGRPPAPDGKVAVQLPPPRGRRRPGGAPAPARRRRGVRLGRRRLCQRRPRAQPRAAGHGARAAPRPGRRCGSRSVRRPPTPRSITCSPSCPRSSNGCEA